MKEQNPYESPATKETEPKPSTPRGPSVPKEAWRGAKFGARIMAVVLSVLAAVGWLCMAGFIAFRWLSTGVSPLARDGALLELGKLIGVTIFAIAVCSFYAAIAGAIIMGVAAIVRKFRGTTIDES